MRCANRVLNQEDVGNEMPAGVAVSQVSDQRLALGGGQTAIDERRKSLGTGTGALNCHRYLMRRTRHRRFPPPQP